MHICSSHSKGVAPFARALSWAVITVVMAAAQTSLAQLRIMSYNCAQLNGNQPAFQDVLAAAQADDKPGFNVPVSVFLFQEVKVANVTPLLNHINAVAPRGVTYAAATFTSNNEDGVAGAQAMFYRSDILTEDTAAHTDIYTGAGRYTDRWRLTMNGYPPSASFYLYSSHLKSDTGSANQNERLLGVTNIRNNSDALPANTNIIYAGDMNLYNNNEPAYLMFLSAGNGQAFDPFGSGSWAFSSDPANAIKHSQSPLLTGAGGLVGGGLDDRFDFQLTSSAMNDSEGVSLIPGTYRSFGNDGNHYNLSINTGNNTYYPDNIPASNAIANDLFIASDHIPVISEFQIPAVMAASLQPDYGRVIQNTVFNIPFDVINDAVVVIVDGADELDYTATGSLGFSGAIADTVLPLGDVSSGAFALNTSVLGPRTGRITFTSASQGVKNPLIIRDTNGTIVRHSNPSFSNSADLDADEISQSFDADSGIHNIAIDIHNFAFDSNQAYLDLDSVTGVASPFGVFSGVAATNIGSTPAQVIFSFDTASLTPGLYTADITINTSDEYIPGETSSSLALTLSISISQTESCDGDVTANGIVDVDDLLEVINAWGACASKDCPADVTANGIIDVDDLLIIINHWGPCP